LVVGWAHVLAPPCRRALAELVEELGGVDDHVLGPHLQALLRHDLQGLLEALVGHRPRLLTPLELECVPLRVERDRAPLVGGEFLRLIRHARRPLRLTLCRPGEMYVPRFWGREGRIGQIKCTIGPLCRSDRARSYSPG